MRAWLDARTSLGSERPGLLFDLATARLLEAKILLPGPTVLSRLIAAAREQASTQLWTALSAATSRTQKQALRRLLPVADGERTSGLDRLRKGPTGVIATGMLGALARLTEIRNLGVGDLDLTGEAPGRLADLARHASAAKAQTVARMTPARRDATLLAAARKLEIAATDDVLDVLDQLLGTVLARAHRAGRQERLRTLPALDVAATHLRDAVAVLLDPPVGGLPALWSALEARVSRIQLEAAVEAINETTRPEVDTHLDKKTSSAPWVSWSTPSSYGTPATKTLPSINSATPDTRCSTMTFDGWHPWDTTTSTFSADTNSVPPTSHDNN